jgi:hypothetical protein
MSFIEESRRETITLRVRFFGRCRELAGSDNKWVEVMRNRCNTEIRNVAVPVRCVRSAEPCNGWGSPGPLWKLSVVPLRVIITGSTPLYLGCCPEPSPTHLRRR